MIKEGGNDSDDPGLETTKKQTIQLQQQHVASSSKKHASRDKYISSAAKIYSTPAMTRSVVVKFLIIS